MLRVQNVSLVFFFFFDTMPFLMELKDDDIGGRGLVSFSPL